jgi:predicted ATPase
MARREGLLCRERELAAIAAFLTAAEERPARLTLDGEPGIGKTTIFEHAVGEAKARGYRVLAARPTSAESALSFVGLTDLLAGVYEVFPELPTPQRKALEVALLVQEAADEPADPRAIGVGLLGVVHALTAASPVLVAVDDLQWLDRPSAAALSFALRRLTTEPVGMLAALRSGSAPAVAEPVRSVAGEEVLLGALTVGAVHALLADRLALSIPRSLLVRVHEASGGNPLFALEIGRVMQESGLPEPGQPFHVPSELQTFFAARLEQLPAETLDALAIAAATAAPTRALVHAEALEPAVRAEIVRLEEERIHFTHPLLASAVYTSLDPGVRARATPPDGNGSDRSRGTRAPSRTLRRGAGS